MHFCTIYYESLQRMCAGRDVWIFQRFKKEYAVVTDQIPTNICVMLFNLTFILLFPSILSKSCLVAFWLDSFYAIICFQQHASYSVLCRRFFLPSPGFFFYAFRFSEFLHDDAWENIYFWSIKVQFSHSTFWPLFQFSLKKYSSKSTTKINDDKKNRISIFSSFNKRQAQTCTPEYGYSIAFQ